MVFLFTIFYLLFTYFMDKHYVCTGGCGAVAPMPGVCMTNNCGRYEHPMMECRCTDGKHDPILNQDKSRAPHEISPEEKNKE